MTPAETKQYATLMLEGVLERVPTEAVISALEKHFSAEELEGLRVTAVGCVRIRADIDERMRRYRAATAQA